MSRATRDHFEATVYEFRGGAYGAYVYVDPSATVEQLARGQMNIRIQELPLSGSLGIQSTSEGQLGASLSVDWLALVRV